jgi:hypothetical protein
VPSKQYSIWPGVESVQAPVDGLLIVGGYDEARKNGDFVNFTSSRKDAPFYVEIVDITWENTPGNVTSIFPSDTTKLFGNLDPFYDAIYLPSEVYNVFQSVSGATYNDTLGKLVYDSLSIPTGTMTVTLSNGYKTQISGSDLFDYPQDYDETGNQYVTNRDLVTAKVEPYYQYPQYWLFIGVPFMTMNYVVADFEQKTWMMAPAVRDDFGQKTALTLKPLCTPANTSTPPPPPAPSRSQSNTAAIGGGVGGGVGGLLLISGLIALILFWRHRKRRAVAQGYQPPPDHGQQQKQQGDMTYSETTETTELPSSAPRHITSWISAQHQIQDYERVRLGCFPFSASFLFVTHLSPAFLCY